MTKVSADAIAKRIKAETVLLAISAEWQHQVAELLQGKGITTLVAHSLEEAKASVTSPGVGGIIITSDWAMEEDKDGRNFIEAVRDKMPTVTLILGETMRESRPVLFSRTYFPPRHEFCIVPFDLDELLGRMLRSGM